jgi:phosphoribosylamine---glycine ligase
VKVLIVSLDSVGEGLALALRAAKAGHDVRIWFGKDCHPDVGDGFGEIARVPEWLSSIKWADLVIPTANHQYTAKFDQLRRAGVKVFGPSVQSAALEVKRGLGMEFFKLHGIEVPPWQEFKSLEAAEEHARANETRYVFKTLGDEEDKSLSYVAQSPADMVARLQRWQRLGLNPKGPVMLQEVIDGTEIGVARWMGTEGWVGPIEENFEFKKLLSGNCGPNCGEAGTVLKYLKAGSKLFDAVLAPLEEPLRALGHLGCVDVNCIVDRAGRAWPLEFTMRLGWPAFNLELAAHQGDPVQWMYDACAGKDTLKASPKVIAGVVLAQPDYPYSRRPPEETVDIPIYGVTAENEPYLYPQSLKRTPMPDMVAGTVQNVPTWATCGDYVLVVTGTGRTVHQAAMRAYDTLAQLKLADGIYRDDIGEKLAEEIPTLQAHGYATDFLYE